MSPMLTRGLLWKSAFGVLIVGSSGLYYSHRYMQNKVRNFPHYKESFEILGNHEQAVLSLGKPIQIGKVDLSDRKSNYVGKLDSKLKIPISGNLNGGYMNVTAARDSEEDEFVTQSIELELQSTADDVSASTDQPGLSGGTYLIYKLINPADEEPEVAPQQSNVVVRWLRWLVGYGYEDTQPRPQTSVSHIISQYNQISSYRPLMLRLLVERLANTMSWPAFIQPHVDAFVEWVNGILEYWDLEYLEYLLWLFLPIFIAFVLPIFLLFFIYGCVIFLHIYGLRHQIREAYASSYWDGARTSIASFWDGVGHLWHGFEVRGLENIPDTGPGLLVAYHGTLPLDLYYVIAKCILYKKRTIHCVADKFVFKIPGWGTMCKVFCMTPGTVEDCISNLKDGNLLIIAPGGVREALFSSAATYQIMWGKRLGFAKVVLGSNVPVIPMFTENCRDAFRTPRWGRRIFRGLYERSRLPICPIYGGFPVKMITHLGEPMYFDAEAVTPEQVKYAVKKEVASLIREHQRLPGSILKGMLQRVYTRRRHSTPVTPQHEHDSSGAMEALLVPKVDGDGTLRNGHNTRLVELRPTSTELKSTPLTGQTPPVEDESLVEDDDPSKYGAFDEEDEVGTSAI